MDPTTADRIEAYVSDLFGCTDEVLEAAQQRADAAGMPAIQVAPSQGRLLMLMARMLRARRVLEVGTLGGYSTIGLARGLAEGGAITTLEFEPRHAEVARGNLDAAGVGDRVEVLVGPAAESLASLIEAGAEPFDLVFIDADKVNYPTYLDQTLRLSRPGTVILADNVLRNGRVLSESPADLGPDPEPENTAGVIEFNRLLAAEPRVEASIMPLFSRKGFDGIAVAVVK